MIAMLTVTMLFGLAFLGIKGVEYYDKFEEHHVPGASFSFDHVAIPGHPGEYADPHHAEIFFSLYFIMTGLHAVHMIVGLGFFPGCCTPRGKDVSRPNITRHSRSAAFTGTSSTSSGSTCFRCCISLTVTREA